MLTRKAIKITFFYSSKPLDPIDPGDIAHICVFIVLIARENVHIVIRDMFQCQNLTLSVIHFKFIERGNCCCITSLL